MTPYKILAMNMTRKLGLVWVFCFVMILVKGQSYTSAFGMRIGVPFGISAKHFVTHSIALEGILSSRYNSILLTGLVEFQYPISQSNTLSWYIGGGAHLGILNSIYTPWPNDRDKYTVVGIDAILGLEYTIPRFPLSLALDMKPTIHIIGDRSFIFDEGALAIRYVIN